MTRPWHDYSLTVYEVLTYILEILEYEWEIRDILYYLSKPWKYESEYLKFKEFCDGVG